MHCKEKAQFQDYKSCLEASQIINIVTHLGKKGIKVDSLKKDKKELIKNRSLLKSQQRFNSHKHNVFIGEIRKIVLSSNDDKRMQSIDSVETYSYGMGKYLIWKKQKIKRINISKRISELIYKNV